MKKGKSNSRWLITGKPIQSLQLGLLWYSSERAIIGNTTIPSQTLAANGDAPRTNTCRGCTSSQGQPTLNRHHPLPKQGRLRTCYGTRTEVILRMIYYCTAYSDKGYTINPANHNAFSWRNDRLSTSTVSGRRRMHSAPVRAQLRGVAVSSSLHDAPRQRTVRPSLPTSSHHRRHDLRSSPELL